MIEIRQFVETDRDYIRKICMDTANKGYNTNPRKRECIANMFIDYYLDFEPQNCFVAVDEGIPCGYIVCSANPELFQQKFKEVYIPKVFKKSFLIGLFSKITAGTSKKLDNLLGGGGFHINIDDKHQGLKLGPKLLTALGKHLFANGHKYMYLVTKNRKTRGYGFYKHFGFEEAKKCGFGTLCLAYDLGKISEKE